MFDFDRVIERRGTHASKWDNMARLSGIKAPDAIPMWVADMDFAAPPGVTAALTAEIERATHGYYADTGSWAAALVDWMARRHGLRIDPGWVSPTPGIVSGLGLILQAVSAPGDEVVVFPPAYHAFRRIILANERRILDAQLVETQGPLRHGSRCAAGKLTPRTKVVFLCSPHNPGGTVWSAEELRALAHFCTEHDLILVSDEIHCDLVFAGAKHTPTIDSRARDRRPPDHMRLRDQDFQSRRRPCRRVHHLEPSIEAPPRCADRGERSWLLQRLRHDRDRGGLADRRGMARCAAALSRRSRDLFDARIRPRRPAPARCTCRHLSRLGRFFRNRPAARRGGRRVKSRARIFASPGAQFGPGGETWLRFNFATPRPILEEALGRLEDAFADLRSRGSEKPAMKRPVVGVIGNARLDRGSVHRAACRGNEPARGRGRRRRAAADVRRHAGNHRYRCAARRGRRHAADRRPRQCPSDPLRRRAASRPRTLRRARATRWRWRWSRSASSAACRCSASAAASRR